MTLLDLDLANGETMAMQCNRYARSNQVRSYLVKDKSPAGIAKLQTDVVHLLEPKRILQ